MRIIYLMLLLAAATVLDGTLFARLAIGAVTPDAFLVALLVWRLLNHGGWALAGACAIGLACDLSAASRLGIVTLAFAAATAAGIWCEEQATRSRWSRYGARLAVAQGLPLVLAISLQLTGATSGPWWPSGFRALAVGGFSLAVALPIVLAAGWCRELHGGAKTTHEFLGDLRATTF